MTKGGADPLKFIHKFPGRYKSFHVKDIDLNGNRRSVGSGIIDFEAILNAKKVAGFLSKNKKVKLLYPHKKGSINFRMWKKYYSGASGLMGLMIKTKNKNSVIKFVNSLKLFGYGYSWGGFESLALHQEIREQGERSYLNLSKDEHIVRLHIGLEDPKDLIEDLRRSLKFIK